MALSPARISLLGTLVLDFDPVEGLGISGAWSKSLVTPAKRDPQPEKQSTDLGQSGARE
jgi:hypothetical protein